MNNGMQSQAIIIRKLLKVTTVSGATLDSIGLEHRR